jgi:hypothetical protein
MGIASVGATGCTATVGGRLDAGVAGGVAGILA